jgi:signal transduction histidine kinase
LAASSKDIELKLVAHFESPAHTNAGYLTRIIDNLISNAIKFSKRSTRVYVYASLKEKDFVLRVKDEGPGFSAQDKELLFQRFKKLSARPTGGETSNGLGLAIVKTLVDRLHGEVELVTEAGKGSEFIVHVPVKIEESVNAQS